MRKLYKLTDQNMCTYGKFQWTLGQWVKTDGTGDLCGPGWLHAYSSPELALFMNPTHACYIEPRLFKADGMGRYKDDRGLKCGVTQLRIAKELQVVEPTIEQCCKFAIYCALKVYRGPEFVAWANAWLSGDDRTLAASSCASANTAANADAYTAAYADAYAANAAGDSNNTAANAANAANAAYAANAAAYTAANAGGDSNNTAANAANAAAFSANSAAFTAAFTAATKLDLAAMAKQAMA